MKSQKWEGKTDAQGRVSISIKVKEDKPFFLQGFIWFKESWRPVNIFWDTTKIWFDLGEKFKDTPYRVQLLIPD